MTRLLIIRHGNTFGPNETPTRVGGRTDLALVESGIAQARVLGRHFKDKEYYPDVVFTSELKRTQQTARYILDELSLDLELQKLEMLNEIDYGPDENKPEKDVIERISQKAIDLWDQSGIVPTGWEFDPDKAIQDWKELSSKILKECKDQTIMIVTSNGIARFAPYITGHYDAFKNAHNIKLKTGAYGLFHHDHNQWNVVEWGVRPETR